MQITAFKAILARRINIQECEDYENTFAQMESDCTLRFGFKSSYKTDCLVYEMLFIRTLKPNLNVQSDSIRAKVFS